MFITVKSRFVDLLFSYNRKVTLGVFYRPPNNDPKPLEDLQAALQEFSKNELILLGDFNLPEIDWLNNRVLRQSDIYTLTFTHFCASFSNVKIILNNPNPTLSL